jgi:hypothetical protein
MILPIVCKKLPIKMFTGMISCGPSKNSFCSFRSGENAFCRNAKIGIQKKIGEEEGDMGLFASQKQGPNFDI